jgi:hypothetical protein
MDRPINGAVEGRSPDTSTIIPGTTGSCSARPSLERESATRQRLTAGRRRAYGGSTGALRRARRSWR